MSGQLSDPGFVSALSSELGRGRPVALASLLATTGSMPRHEGARLAVLSDGSVLGTVGGGNVELMAIDAARAALGSDSPAPAAPASLEWLTHERNDMACGGDALLAVRVLTSADAPLVEGLSGLLASGGRATLEERWSDPSRPTWALLDGDLARHASWDAGSATYREPVGAPETCHVFGAGHVGTALVPVLSAIGFVVRVYDDRPEAADPARFPEGTVVSCGDFAELAEGAPIAPRDSVVVLTHGHAADAVVLERVLRREVAYVGCIGSRRKAALVRDGLVGAGISRERADSVHLPIGEDILAVTPAEIAVSIAAQLIRCRAERRADIPTGKEG